MQTLVLNITGMTCAGCVNSITRVLERLPGVARVEVSLQSGQARIDYDPALSLPESFKTAIEEAGYEVSS